MWKYPMSFFLSAFCIVSSTRTGSAAAKRWQSHFTEVETSAWSTEPLDDIGHSVEVPQPALLSAAVSRSDFARDSWLMSTEPWRRIGHAIYASKSDQATWGSLYEMDTGFGMKCHPSENPCREHGLVCRNRMCGSCRRDSECPLHHVCGEGEDIRNVRLCKYNDVPTWEKAFSEDGTWILVGTVLIFISAVFAATAGVGGGGIFVPLLIMCCGKPPSQAIPIAQAMIFTGSIINIVSFITQRHPEVPSYPVVDYNCIALLEPLLCTGVVLGVIAGQACPSWFLVLLLAVTLLPAIQRTGTKGRKQWTEEKAREEATREERANSRTERGESVQERRTCCQSFCSYLVAPFVYDYKGFADRHINSFVGIMTNNYLAMLMVVVVWGMVFAIFILWAKQMSICSYKYVIFLSIIVVGFVILTWAIGRYVVKKDKSDPEAEKTVDWGQATYKYPIVGMIAGFLGGLLGLGGGVIMSPVLLELGMHSEAVQATTATFVFISSSVATLQFIMLQVYKLDEVIWYCSITFTATALGQWVFGAWVRRTKRYSLITLSVAGILLLSLISLSIIGTLKTHQDWNTEGAMEFHPQKICGSSGTQSTIVTNSRAAVR